MHVESITNFNVLSCFKYDKGISLLSMFSKKGILIGFCLRKGECDVKTKTDVGENERHPPSLVLGD